MKSVESEVYSQFKIEIGKYTSQILTESLNQNTFILTKSFYKTDDKELIDKIEKLRIKSTIQDDSEADKSCETIRAEIT